MKFEEKTLDLTGFNRGNFAGIIRIRQIADWADDYWRAGYQLARIKLHDEEWHELMHEIEQDNRFIKNTPMQALSFNLGYGEIEIINVDKEIRISLAHQ